MIEFERVVKILDSWAINEVAYSLPRRELRLHFPQTKSVWVYYEVPPKIFTDLLLAESIGAYFNDKIRTQFEAVRVSPAPGDADDGDVDDELSSMDQQGPFKTEASEG